MLYTIQTFLEDFFSNRNYSISDTYAIKLAKLYYHNRATMKESVFLHRMSRIRTVFFINNDIDSRSIFEENLLVRLDKRFKKKLSNPKQTFPGGFEKEKKEIHRFSRRSIAKLIELFMKAVEARAIGGFWLSRTKKQLKSKPESIAHALFGSFSYGVLDGRGISVMEFGSGIGYVDFGIIFSNVLHLVEIKILSNKFTGPNQLEQYMKTEDRREGHLLVFDARPPGEKDYIKPIIETPSGKIFVSTVDINPPAPSSLN